MGEAVDLNSAGEPSAPGPVPGPGEAEEIDALPVLAEEARVLQPHGYRSELGERRSAVTIPAMQAAAVAAGGFVAGAAVVGLVHRRQRQVAPAKGRRVSRRLGRGGRRERKAGTVGELVQIVGSRSLLVDVHLLGGGADG